MVRGVQYGAVVELAAPEPKHGRVGLVEMRRLAGW